MRKTSSLGFVSLLVFLGLSACAPNISPDSYALGSVGQANRAVRGVVISARSVAISGTNSGLGAGVGAVGGGVGGAVAGGNSLPAAIVGTVGGAVVGGIAGAVVEDAATKQNGMEYVVQTENGALITVVQGSDLPFSVKQKVIVIYGSRTRVIADQSE